jgi:hypothetical protein
MLEREHRDASDDRGMKRPNAPLQLLIKLTTWILEILAEAVGTCLIVVAIPFLEFRHEVPPLHNDLTLSKALGIALVIVIEFAITGYLATTLIARFAWLGRMQRFYPYVCAGLYLLHSTIFFVVAAGNSLFRGEDLAIQLGGACLALTCTWCGNQLVAHWSRSRRNEVVLRNGLR